MVLESLLERQEVTGAHSRDKDTGPFTESQRTEQEDQVFRGNKKLHLGHVKLEMLVHHPKRFVR